MDSRRLIKKLTLSGYSFRTSFLTIGVLITGLILSAIIINYNYNIEKNAAIRDFEYSCNQVRIKIETRLEEHAQLLRGGMGLIAVSDTVTREEWENYYSLTKINTFLPGIQGFGYSKLIKPGEIGRHEEHFRKVYSDYKPNYKVYPDTPRRKVYSAIIYLQPHNERNMTALGYDMFNDPVRRKAMEAARDSGTATLTGKVTLVQEIDDDIQAGVLMYVADYRKGLPLVTVEQRRAAIRGWVYSPYRMRDLMQGIRGTMAHYEEEPLRLRIYDDTVISETNLMYDSRKEGLIDIEKPNISLSLPVDFRGNIWTLVFDGRKDELSILYGPQLFILLTGILISILLFTLSTLELRSVMRARKIEQLNKQLERLNADKDRFIATLSHDLKSPFTSILGFLDLLSSNIHRFSIEKIIEQVNLINDSARHTYDLLEDLLMWTRAHSGQIPYKPVRLSLRDIFNNVRETIGPHAESKNIELSCTVPGNFEVMADKNMLKAVLRNLLSNAIKFTGNGGTVQLAAVSGDDTARIDVIDNGIGIEPHRLESLFDIAKILPAEGTDGEKGSGLGLILCKEFVERHGGEIWVESEKGKGSTFSFTLPY